MRVDKGHPDYERLVAAFNHEGNPRILRQGSTKWTWYTDKGELFFIATSVGGISDALSQNAFGKGVTTPRKEPDLK